MPGLDDLMYFNSTTSHFGEFNELFNIMSLARYERLLAEFLR